MGCREPGFDAGCLSFRAGGPGIVIVPVQAAIPSFQFPVFLGLSLY